MQDAGYRRQGLVWAGVAAILVLYCGMLPPAARAAESEHTPYTEFSSLKPDFREDPLDGEPVEITAEDIDVIYSEFRDSSVSLPDAVLEERISPGEAAGRFAERAGLCGNINKLIFSASDESMDKYGPVLQAMRDVVYLDALCLNEYARGGDEYRPLWRDLRARWASAVEERYRALTDKDEYHGN